MSDRSDRDARAGEVFEALADPTRRTLLRSVAARGPVTATELAAELPVSRQAVAKHLGLLRRVGLVESERLGRETRFSLRPAPLGDAGQWLEEAGAAWDARLLKLQAAARSR